MGQKLTQKDYDEKVAELEMLKTTGRNEIAEKIKEARSHGDLSENSEYDEAMNDQGRLEAHISELEEIIKNAEIITEFEKGVHLGSIVELEDLDLGDIDEYVILGESEKASDDVNYISGESPVGKAIMGKEAGAEIEAEAPGGISRFRIVSVK